MKHRTIACAYSLRASPLALVSAPVTWAELPEVEMADFTIESMPVRFAALGDVHAGIDDREGEPPRVQPSRKNKANWTDDGRPAEIEPQPLD